MFGWLSRQIMNQPIFWQQLNALWCLNKVKVIWSSEWALQQQKTLPWVIPLRAGDGTTLHKDSLKLDEKLRETLPSPWIVIRTLRHRSILCSISFLGCWWHHGEEKNILGTLFVSTEHCFYNTQTIWVKLLAVSIPSEDGHAASMLQSSAHLQHGVHSALMTSAVTRAQSSRAPLSLGKTDSHVSADKSAETTDFTSTEVRWNHPSIIFGFLSFPSTLMRLLNRIFKDDHCDFVKIYFKTVPVPCFPFITK